MIVCEFLSIVLAIFIFLSSYVAIQHLPTLPNNRSIPNSLENIEYVKIYVFGIKGTVTGWQKIAETLTSHAQNRFLRFASDS